MDLRDPPARAVVEGQPGDRREESEEVKTPCIRVCTMDPQRDVCLGCCRTLDEIMRWSAMSDAERDRVMAGLPQRRSALDIREIAVPPLA
jgi:predicted Fe-S protein YdhL (DUF1289 family)